MNGYAVQDAWAKHSLAQQSRSAQLAVDAEQSHKAAAAWCKRYLPDLVDARTGWPCSFAVAAALRLRGELAQRPTPDQVRRYRAGWMRHLGVEEL